MKQTEREPIHIEDLLVLAYRDHHVDRITPEGILALRTPVGLGVSSTAMIGSHLALGTEIDRSSAGANFIGRANMMASIADDFLAVHDAVLALPAFFVEVVSGADFVVWDEAMLLADRAFGVVVEGKGANRRIGSARYTPAAVREPRALRNGVPLDPAPAPVAPAMRPLHHVEGATTAILHGRAGGAPYLADLAVASWRPVVANKRTIRFDPVWETLPAEVAILRGTYAAWHASLVQLADALVDLDRFYVLSPALAAEPWAGVPVVHRVPEPAIRARPTSKAEPVQ